ncbi:hypothetical protein [Capsulimonas corticalis]|uniref:hypothetical protein n=1 Tax=Capsulimonas corticalis TaxID=2219043 RepID=UPI000F650B0B|nr:hypothetical protein [Capsulimonas corticalis]
MQKRLLLTCVAGSLLALAAAQPGFAQTGKSGVTMAGDPRYLPEQYFTITSALHVDMMNNSGTLPLHKGTCNGQTVWYVITDVSDAGAARDLGVNFAPPIANLLDSPGQVQTVTTSSLPLGRTGVEFAGQPDFSPMRRLLPSEKGFPPLGASPGSMGDIHYSSFVKIGNGRVVYNAPIVATGDGPFDVKTHKNTQDRVTAIDTDKMTVDLLFVRGFADGEPVLYLSFDDSDAGSSVIERANFAPGLNTSPSPNGGKDPSMSARAALFTFVNGQTHKASPPAQGLNHVIIDGHNDEDASLDNSGLMESLRMGGDARNVLENFPTLSDPKMRAQYTPLWDVHVGEWSPQAVARELNVAQMDANQVRHLAKKGWVTAPGGSPLGSANIVVNCPALAFTDQKPLAPQAPKPKNIP